MSNVILLYRENYPYFKAEDDRWKNSVRHNLSMNPNFRKGGRAKQGSGHVWILADLGEGLCMVSSCIYLGEVLFISDSFSDKLQSQVDQQ